MFDDNQQIYSKEEAEKLLKSGIYNMRERLIIDGKGTERDVPSLSETIISKPQHQFGLTTFSDYLGKMKEVSEFRLKETLWKDEVKIDIKTPYKWFGVRPIGDLHIGSEGLDYEYLSDFLAGLIQNDNLKTIGIGDLGDFFVPQGKHAEGMMNDVVNPQTQLVALKKFFTEYQDEFLANTNDPSHADWVYQTSGIDVYEYLCRELRVPLVTQGGSIKINFGDIEYDIMPFHNIARFKSSFNLTHAHKRALELHRDADVVIAGHIHKGAFEKAYKNGHEVALVQIGTMDTGETGSRWAKKQGFLGGVRPYYPIILFNTEEKRMQIIDNLKDAEDMLSIKK